MDQALQGMQVTEGMNLYKLADLSSIWVHADVYESELSWVRKDQAATVELSYFPGETFHGKVLYLYPELNAKTRTVKVCVEIPNLSRRLRPGMYANVRIQGDPIPDVVAVPDSSILRSGERNVVFLDLGEGRYRPQEVELGVQGEGNLVEIRKGLQGGERVVVQAQFMLDSESRVREAIRKMQSRKEIPEATPLNGDNDG
jgi:RND family efflux transporter MFP subunit